MGSRVYRLSFLQNMVEVLLFWILYHGKLTTRSKDFLLGKVVRIRNEGGTSLAAALNPSPPYLPQFVKGSQNLEDDIAKVGEVVIIG